MTQNEPKNMNKLLAIAGAVFALILLLLYMQGSFVSKVAPGVIEKTADLKLSTAQTSVVEKKQVDDIMSWPGTVKSRTVANIAPKMTARILEIKVHASDKVKQGDVLARLDERDIAAQEQAGLAVLAGAIAEGNRAKADADRIQSLYAKEAATKEHLDAIIAQDKAAQARVIQANSTLNEVKSLQADTLLRAPFDGVVLKRFKEPGDMGLPGVPVISLQAPQGLRLEADVPTSCASQFTIGMHAKVRIDTLGKTVMAQIDEISPDVDAQTRTQLIKVTLPTMTGLQAGYFGWLEQSCAQHEALLIPVSAVQHIGQLEVVKELAEGHQVMRHIRTAKVFGDQIEVLSGLVAGEVVISNPQQAQ